MILPSWGAQACPEEKRWTDFSTISFKSGQSARVTLRRFSDADHAQVGEGDSMREMLQLKGGYSLFKGYDPSSRRERNPFLMLDMPVGILLNLLAQRISRPCDLPAGRHLLAEIPRSGKADFVLNGYVAQLPDRVGLSFEFTAEEQRASGAVFQASGEIEFAEIGPIPRSMPIGQWVITRGSGATLVPRVVDPGKPVETLRELDSLDIGTLVERQPLETGKPR